MRGEYISNLVFGIVFTVIGGVGYVVQAVKNSKNAPVSAPQTSGLNGNVTERTDDIPKE